MSSRLSVAALAAVVALAGPAHADVTVPRPKAAPPLVSGPAEFDPTGWTALGRKTLIGTNSREVVTLSGSAATVDQLTLVVDGDLDVSRVTVVTAGGKRLVRRLEHRFGASSKSRRIELAGNDQALRSVELVYRLAKYATATLTVYGRSSALVRTAATFVAATKGDEAPVRTTITAETSSTGPAFSARAGWTLLGAQTVDGRDDSDTVRVPKDVIGMFDRIAIVVTGGDLELSALKLRFAGGSTADIDHHYYFRGSDRSRIVSVPGGEGSVVRVIQLRYGKDRGGGKTRVELWAR